MVGNVPFFKFLFMFSWLARPAFYTTTVMFSSVWLAWLKWAGTGRSFLPFMTSLWCSLKWSANLRPFSLMYTVAFGARQTINHVVRDTGKISSGVNMPWGWIHWYAEQKLPFVKNCDWMVVFWNVYALTCNLVHFEKCYSGILFYFLIVSVDWRK